MGTWQRRCATVPQPSALRFGMVRVHGGPTDCCIRLRSATSCKGKGRFGGVSIFTMGNAIRSPTVKYFLFVCENFTRFPLGKRVVGKLDSWAFWRDQRWGLWKQKSNTVSHCPRPGLPLATRPCFQITLVRLVVDCCRCRMLVNTIYKTAAEYAQFIIYYRKIVQ